MTTPALVHQAPCTGYINNTVQSDGLPASYAPEYHGHVIGAVTNPNTVVKVLSGGHDRTSCFSQTLKCRATQTHPVMENNSLKSYRASDVYAALISQPGNSDDANDIVPDMLVRMRDGLCNGRSLVIQEGDVVKRYASYNPLGGEVIPQPDSLSWDDTVYVCLNTGDKGDSMYRKILAAARQTAPSHISASDIAGLREQVAGFVRNNPALAEEANNALEDDPFHTLPVDDAIAAYNNSPHSKDPVYTHRPARPWLEPLIHLLAGVMPVIQNAIKGEPLFGPLPTSATMSVDFHDNAVIQQFRDFINDHRHLDRFITELDQAIDLEDKKSALTHKRKDLIQTGKRFSQQLKQVLESGALLSKAGSLQILAWFTEFADFRADNRGPVRPPVNNSGAISRTDSATESGLTTLPAPTLSTGQAGVEGRPVPCCQSVDGVFETIQGYVLDSIGYIDSFLRLPMAEAVSTPGNDDGMLESTSAPDVFESSLLANSSVDNVTEAYDVHIQANRTLLYDPASHIPAFDQRNPNITVSEHAYEFSRLVLGLLQLRFVEVEGVQRPFYMVPVLVNADTREIEYRSIYLPDVSIQDVNDLAKENPHGAVTGNDTLACRLGETCYQSSLWDRLLYPEFGTGKTKSTQSINQVIDNFYHFTPGQGYQLNASTLSYSQVLTGVSNVQQAIQLSLDGDVSRPVSSGIVSEAEHALRDTASELAHYRSVFVSINDAVDKLFESDGHYPEHISDLFRNPEGFAGEAHNDLPTGSKRDFVLKYRRFCYQQQRPVTLLTSDKLQDYLELLQPAVANQTSLRLTDRVWVKSEHNGLHLLIPYSLQKMLSGALSGYDPEQLKLPAPLVFLSTIAVHDQFTEILQEACLLLNDSQETLEHYLQRSMAERPVTTPLDQNRLQAYLNLLLPDCMDKSCLSITEERKHLTLADQVWVKGEHDNTPLLFPYTVGEVLSGATVGYDPQQLILPGALENFRHFITHAGFNEIMDETYSAQCSARIIATNRAPTEYLEQCGHFKSRLQDNRFIRNTINQIVDEIIEYQFDLHTKVAERLGNRAGTSVYKDSELESFITQWKALVALEKQRFINLHPGISRDKRELERYLQLLSPDREEDENRLPLITKVWFRSERDGIRLLVPIRLREVFSGRISGLDPEAFIVPPALEPALPFMTSQDFMRDMNKIYQKDNALRALGQIKIHLASVLSQQFFIKKLFERLVREADCSACSDIGLTTPIGEHIFKQPNVPFIPFYGLLPPESIPYTAYDCLINSAGVCSGSSSRGSFQSYDQYRSGAVGDFIDRLRNIDTENEYSILINNLVRNNEFVNGLREVMSLNSKYYQPAHEADEMVISFGNKYSLGIVHPFITASSAFGYITLFSYLTGAKKTVPIKNNEFYTDCMNPESDTFLWLMLHGGETFKNQWMTIRPRMWGFERANLEGVNTRKQFILNAHQLLLDAASFNMDSLVKTDREQRFDELFECLRTLTAILGFVPVVGDLLEFSANVVLNEIEIGLEETYGDQMRDQRMRELGLSAALSLIPDVSAVAVSRKVVKKVCAHFTDSWITRLSRTRISRINRLQNPVDLPGITANKFTDGLPNRRLNIDGSPRRPVIEPGSKSWARICELGARRKKRSPPGGAACGIPIIDESQAAAIKSRITVADSNAIKFYYDKIYENILFAGRNSASNVDIVLKAFDNVNFDPFLKSLRKYDIEGVGIGFVDGCKEFLTSMKTAQFPEVPNKLKKATNKSKELQAKSTALYIKVSENPKDAAKLQKAKKAHNKLERFKEVTYKPLEHEFKLVVQNIIDTNPLFRQLQSTDQSIKGIVTDSVSIEAPVMRSIRTWGINILYRRAMQHAGLL